MDNLNKKQFFDAAYREWVGVFEVVKADFYPDDLDICFYITFRSGSYGCILYTEESADIIRFFPYASDAMEFLKENLDSRFEGSEFRITVDDSDCHDPVLAMKH